jgi:hypothetical protein
MISFPRSPFRLIDRRQLLHAGALGALGLSLPQLLRAEAMARPRKIKSCILILAHGGPSQQETFDMKPTAPDNIRGDFKPIPTNVPGIAICEYLPRLTKVAKHFSLIRSATHKFVIHNPSSYYALTGRKPDRDVIQFPARRSDWPAVGTVLAKFRPSEPMVPPYVVLPIFANDINIPTPGQHAGFLGSAYDPLIVRADPNQPDFAVPALTPRPEVTVDRLESRLGLLARVNAQAESLGQAPATRVLDGDFERAIKLVTSPAAKEAFDISRESEATRDRYGRNRHGQSVLLARRLVEAGVRLVLVNDTEPNGQNKVWDTHVNGFKTLREHLPVMDNALASLIEDLHYRGLLESTLIVWMGEFGRSPVVSNAGRDHWPHAYSLLMAGGGIRGGHVHGASDARGAYPRDNPVAPEDIHATIYHALGLPQDTHVVDALNRPQSLYNGRPIEALF